MSVFSYFFCAFGRLVCAEALERRAPHLLIRLPLPLLRLAALLERKDEQRDDDDGRDADRDGHNGRLGHGHDAVRRFGERIREDLLLADRGVVVIAVEVVGKDADRFIIHHGFRLRTDRIAAVIAAAAVVAEHEQKMTLVREQLRIKRFRAALKVGNRGALAVRQDVHIGLHAGFLIEFPESGGQLALIMDPVAVCVGIVAGLCDGVRRERFTRDGGLRDAARRRAHQEKPDAAEQEQHEKHDDERRAAARTAAVVPAASAAIVPA